MAASDGKRNEAESPQSGESLPDSGRSRRSFLEHVGKAVYAAPVFVSFQPALPERRRRDRTMSDPIPPPPPGS
jgi:hypothetical protein